MKKSTLPPALVLLFLSPVIGELLSGSAPPAEFFAPFGFILLVGLYGGGAILARELLHHWGKGWPTLLMLGAAYGIAEEGLMVKSFFDPNWEDLGALADYGRWLGVNWVWSLHLTIFHAVFSIAIPILLVSLIFPVRCSQPWVSRRTFKLLSILWVAEAIFIFAFITPYRPPLVPCLLTAAMMIGLIVLARRLPDATSSAIERERLAHPFWFGLVGFAATVILFLLSWVPPTTEIPPLLTMLLMIGLTAMVGWVILRVLSKGTVWSARHQLALASGALSFFILLAPLQELDATRLDDTTGMGLVGLVMAVFLAWMAWRVRRKVKCAVYT